jgi:L-amino acid N-acyltransferase YncA
MAEADLCIGAAGMSSWERCALGLPSLTIAVADNQTASLAGLANRGAVVPLTLEQARDPATLTQAIAETIERAAELSVASAALCDGLGADRVLDALDWRFHPMDLSDEKRLYSWRNSPEIRAVSHNSDPLDPDQHAQWIRRTAGRTDGIWAIYHEGDTPLGFASAVPGDNAWTWSFYLGADCAPGTGTRMMQRFLTHLSTRNVPRVVGEVKADNAASVALHRRLGFQQVDARDGVLVFARAIGETDG